MQLLRRFAGLRDQISEVGELLHDQGESLQALLHSARLRRREADDVSQRLLSDLNQRRSAQEQQQQQQRAMPPRPSSALARGESSAGLRLQARLPSHVLHSALDGEDGQRDCSICLDPLLVSLSLLSCPPSLPPPSLPLSPSLSLSLPPSLLWLARSPGLFTFTVVCVHALSL